MQTCRAASLERLSMHWDARFRPTHLISNLHRAKCSLEKEYVRSKQCWQAAADDITHERKDANFTHLPTAAATQTKTTTSSCARLGMELSRLPCLSGRLHASSLKLNWKDCREINRHMDRRQRNTAFKFTSHAAEEDHGHLSRREKSLQRKSCMAAKANQHVCRNSCVETSAWRCFRRAPITDVINQGKSLSLKLL